MTSLLVPGRLPSLCAPGRRALTIVVLMVLAILHAAMPLHAAQPPGVSQLRVTVVDQTGAVIVGAVVRVTAAVDAVRDGITGARGQIVVADLPAGAAHVTVEAPGFRPFAGDVSLKRGDNRWTARLQLAALEEQVIVRDAEANDRRGNAFTRVLSEAQIAAMPDDPDELEELLQQMAGPGAVVRVNGFRGGRLPPKNQIRQIRFRTNSFAAENHDAGHVSIDVFTKPGFDGWGGSTNLAFRDRALNARNAFASERGPEQTRRYMGNVSGPLQPGKTSISVAIDGAAAYDSKTVVAALLDGAFRDQVKRPTDSAAITAALERALSNSQVLRVEYQRRREERDQLGVGDFDLPSRGFSRRRDEQLVRASASTMIGRQGLNELRVQVGSSTVDTWSISADPAVVVLGAFATGGAGMNGTRRARTLEVANNTDFTVGKAHAVRAGVLLEAGHYAGEDAQNGNGTFTFGSLEAFGAGRPNTFGQRIGGKRTAFAQVQLGLYVQDDFRVGRNLSVSAGLRHEWQSHLPDAQNWAPRAGFTWTPRAGRTTVRGGYGVFYDWYRSELYEQTLRVDGISQRELLVLQPGYPDPFAGATAVTLPPGRIQASPSMRMPTVRQASIGVERSLNSHASAQTSYAWTRGTWQLRAVDVNAPVPGIGRADRSLGTVTELGSTGRSTADRLQVGLQIQFPARRIVGGMNYILSRSRNMGDSPLSLPADNLRPDAEWGPAADDARHRAFGMLTLPLPKGIRVSGMTQFVSALPYTITTGGDDNGDGVSNDRPAGVGRNSARGRGTWSSSVRVSRAIAFGGVRADGGGTIMQRRVAGGDGDGPTMMTMEQSAQRFRVDVYAQAFNVFNRSNLQNFVGNRQSPFFGRATAAGAPRRIEVGLGFAF